MKRMLAMALVLALALGLGAVPALAAEGFEPVVLADSDDIAVTVTAYDPDGGNGPAFEFLLENKTDQELVFNTQGVAVNDVMLSCRIYETVEPNSELNSRMDLFGDASEKEEKGIRYVQDVQAYLLVLGENEAVYADLVSWSVPGTGDGGPAVEAPASDSSFAPIQVFSGDVAVTVTDATYAPDDALRIKFAVKNDMDEIMRAYATDIMINGAAIDTIVHSWSATVLPGAMNSKSFNLTAEDIRELGAGAAETVDFGMAISDLRMGNVIEEGQFTLDLNSLASVPEQEPTAGGDVEEQTALTPEEEAALAEEEAASAVEEEAAAEEPAEAPADAGEAPALAGRLDTDTLTYTNDVFGISCTVAGGWSTYPQEEYASRAGWSEDSGEDPAAYMDKFLAGDGIATIFYAFSGDGTQNISLAVNSFEGAGMMTDSADAATQTNLAMLATGDTRLKDMGYLNGAVLPGPVIIGGEEYLGTIYDYDQEDGETGELTHVHQEAMYLVYNDDAADRCYVMTIMMTAQGADTIGDMGSCFTMPENG